MLDAGGQKGLSPWVQLIIGIAFVALVIVLVLITGRLFWYLGLVGLCIVVFSIIAIAKQK